MRTWLISVVTIALHFAITASTVAEEQLREWSTDYLPDALFKTVVLLEEPVESDSTVSYIARGSGVLVSHKDKYYLVTARHIASKLESVVVRFHGVQDTSGVEHIPLDSLRHNKGDWVHDSSVDVSAIRITPQAIHDAAEKVLSSRHFCKLESDLRPGKSVYVIGYPSSVASVNYHVVRNGIIAAHPRSGIILIDSQMYPGNSGGPVILKGFPDLIAEDKNPSIGMRLEFKGRRTKFVGIVSAYLNYTDVAKSTRTGRTRVTFEENSGLAVVVTAPAIIRLLDSIE